MFTIVSASQYRHTKTFDNFRELSFLCRKSKNLLLRSHFGNQNSNGPYVTWPKTHSHTVQSDNRVYPALLFLCRAHSTVHKYRQIFSRIGIEIFTTVILSPDKRDFIMGKLNREFGRSLQKLSDIGKYTKINAIQHSDELGVT